MRLDLHGYHIHVAWRLVNNFLYENYFSKTKTVIVICGHGLIKNEIEEWLRLHPKVRDFKQLANGGSYQVKLKKPVDKQR